MIQPFGALEVRDRDTWRRATIHDVLWAELRTRPYPPRFTGLDRTILPSAMETTRFDAERRRDRLKAIERLVTEAIEEHGSIADHPWCFATRPDIQFLDVPDIADAAQRVQSELDQLSVEADKLRELGFPAPAELDGLRTFGAALSSLPVPDGSTDDGVLKRLLVLPGAATELSRIADLLEERKLREAAEQSHRLAEGAVAPTADDIAELCRRAVEAGLADYSLDSIAQGVKATREELARWSKLVGLAECLRDLLGLRDDLTPRILRRAIEAVDLLTSVERPALLARSPSVVDEAARPVLDKAHVRLGTP